MRKGLDDSNTGDTEMGMTTYGSLDLNIIASCASPCVMVEAMA